MDIDRFSVNSKVRDIREEIGLSASDPRNTELWEDLIVRADCLSDILHTTDFCIA